MFLMFFEKLLLLKKIIVVKTVEDKSILFLLFSLHRIIEIFIQENDCAGLRNVMKNLQIDLKKVDGEKTSVVMGANAGIVKEEQKVKEEKKEGKEG